MNVSSSRALQPISPSYGLALRADEDRYPGASVGGRGQRRDFVFLGYGPRTENPLYDASGKALERASSGSLVDLYV
ncbi:MAG: hypothetical protein PVG49_19145 [Desulfobacteraceae bacterium]|jgi:hypothetical protein